MTETAETIRQNFQQTLERVNQAAVSAGRDPSEVTIVGVTKYVDADLTRMLFKAGCQNLGESRPQALEQKATAISNDQIVWHLIGHLQRNKVARTLNSTNMIHSVDSDRLLKAIDRIAGERGISKPEETAPAVQVLLEVNVSGDQAKHGFQADELQLLIPKFARLEHVELRGLMCMAGLTSSETETRQQFSSLRELRDQIQGQLPDDHRFTELSMGMSGDFELAIAEGATLVRIGSVLFKGVR